MDILIRMLMAVLKDRKHKKQRRVLSTVLAAVVVFMTTYSLILPAITLEESTAETTDGIFLESADVSEADPADDDVDPSGELLLTDDAREESAQASDGWEDGLIEDADWEENGELADIPDEPALTDTGDEATPDGILEEATDAAEAEEDTQALSFTDGELTVRETLVSRQGGEDFLRLTYGAEARIPEDTVCSAQAFIPASSGAAMDEGSSLAEKYEQAAREKAARDYPEWDKIEVRMFDLHLAANGQTVQAENALHAELTLAQPIRSEALLLLHFEDNEAQEELRRIHAGETAGASSVEVHLPEVMHDAEFIRNANGEVYKIRFASQTLNTFAVVIRGESEETENRKEETAHETEPLTEAGTEAGTEAAVETLTESTAAGDETEEAAETETGNVYAETEEATEAVTETASEATEEATEDTTESEESVGEGETESELEEQYPEVEFSDSTQYTQVKVYAPEGAFPEGTQMLLSDVEDDETIAAICDAALAENSLVQKVHAVDISFRNSRNEEIEPLLPIRVEMTAEKCAEVGSSSVSSSVVHVDDSGNATIVENAQKVEAEAEDEKDADKLEDVETIAFEAKEFSVYALVYTVDFEYSVNGKMYQFSLPGGGFVSFTDLVEVLGITHDTNSDENEDKNESVIAENAEENGDNEGEEENGVYSDTNTPLTLGDVEVSEATRKFVADVASVECSSPELVDVSKVESESTVGQIKDNRGLECEYSAELTEGQIAEINAQTVEAGDWALISMQPFTSEETLTITMKDGKVFTVKVTDAQIKKNVIDAKGDTWEITVTYGEDAKIPDGAELKVREIFPEDRKYEQYYQQSLKKTREGIDTEVSSDNFGYAHIFDIEILNQGQKIEPESNVSVAIKLLDTPQEIATLRVVHFSTEGPEIIDIEKNKEKGGETELGFVTDEFSVYAVIEDVDHGEPDLANRTVRISVGGYYLTNRTNYNTNPNPWEITKTNNVNQAADYQFEATNTPGVYRVYTMINGQKNYMHINHHTGDPHSDDPNSACVNLTRPEYTMDLHVVQNSDGTYGIYRNDGGTNYYLNQYGGERGTGFAAYADADGGGNSKLTFTSVPADPNALKAGTHIMLAKIDEYYYIVNNDGTLTSVEYIEATNQVKVENPMMWTYTGTNLYHNSDAVDFNGSMIASDYYYKYIDPSTGTGISEDNDDNTTTEIAGYKEVDGKWVPYYRIVSGTRQMQSQSALTYTNKHLKSSNGDYYIGVTEENGVLKLAGGKDSDHAVEILFASPTAVLPVDSSNHTVSHIDISIEGTSEVDVPLAYGKYYNEAGKQILEVSSYKTVSLIKEGIGISTDDMKKAAIVAYIKDANGHAVPIDNAFYITGYSANAATEYSTPQVRIEGSFKVANLPVTDQEWEHRLNNKIYYSVTAVKTVTFDLIDPELGQLYDAEGNKLTITIDVAFSASFDYWDERNECPPVKWDSVNWPKGNIPGGSGMDFVLGGDAEQTGSNIVAIEITKLVVDENGNRIKPSTSTPVNNSFEIWQDADGNPNSVIGMGIDGMPINVNYGDYVNLHSKNIKVGVDGIGLVYDYDVTPGMYYIREDPNSVRDDIVDTDGNYWEYAGTRIETESPWRDDSANDGKYHVSGIYTKDGGTYNAVPEVLGNYSDINGNTTWIDHDDGNKVKPVRNGFLEFFVYNIYKPVQTDITLKKVDKANLNDSDPDLLKGASFTVTKYSDQNFQGIDSTWGTSGSMTVSDDEKEDGTYTLNGVFEFQGLPAGYYQIEETRFPDGYIKLSGNPRFKVEENASHELVVTLINNPDNLLRLEDDKLTIIVGNTPGAALPNTGGPGTRLFTILGSILILGAGVLLWRRRRTI